ncbi:MAG: GTP-binding protein HflX [Bradymonadia bacterium]|jgi:GTP-binding protein HflX
MSAQLPPREDPDARHAILTAVQLQGVTEADIDRTLSELRRLAEGLGVVVIDTIVQRRASDRASHLFGRGKLDAIVAHFHEDAEPQADLLLVNNELSPGQQYFLEKAIDAEVMDRTAVILSVFESRARTHIARVELDIARLEYAVPRMRDLEEPDREGGGNRGERGHTQAELRRQQTRRRRSVLRKQVEAARAADDMARERRQDMPVAAIVGYTNAGKSSLMRAMTGDDVLVADQLFATLGSTVRAIEPETDPKTLIVDTVGFIEALPHALVASFRSTLEETRLADLLLFVVDAADPLRGQQLEVTQQTVTELLAERDAEVPPSLLVFNKIDKLDDAARAALTAEYPDALQISTFDLDDIARVRAIIEQHMREGHQTVWLRVPFTAGHLIGEVHGAGRVIAEAYDAEGTLLHVQLNPAELARMLKLGAVKTSAPQDPPGDAA